MGRLSPVTKTLGNHGNVARKGNQSAVWSTCNTASTIIETKTMNGLATESGIVLPIQECNGINFDNYQHGSVGDSPVQLINVQGNFAGKRPDPLQLKAERKAALLHSYSPRPAGVLDFASIPSNVSRRNSTRSFVGSYEESLLSQSLPLKARHSVNFSATFTVAQNHGKNMNLVAPRLIMPLTAYCFEDCPHWAGHVNISSATRPFRIPKRGRLQIVLQNTSDLVVASIYFVNYDVSDMPEDSRTILRQRNLCNQQQAALDRVLISDPSETEPQLQSSIQLPLLRKSGSKYILLDGNIRLLFPVGQPWPKTVTIQEFPSDPKYFSIDGKETFSSDNYASANSICL